MRRYLVDTTVLTAGLFRRPAAIALLTPRITQRAALSGLSHSQLQLVARTGRLQAQRLGTDWFTTPEAVAEYVNNPEGKSAQAVNAVQVVQDVMNPKNRRVVSGRATSKVGKKGV